MDIETCKRIVRERLITGGHDEVGSLITIENRWAEAEAKECCECLGLPECPVKPPKGGPTIAEMVNMAAPTTELKKFEWPELADAGAAKGIHQIEGCPIRGIGE